VSTLYNMAKQDTALWLVAVFYAQRLLICSYCCCEQRKCKNAAAYWYSVYYKETVFV